MTHPEDPRRPREQQPHRQQQWAGQPAALSYPPQVAPPQAPPNPSWRPGGQPGPSRIRSLLIGLLAGVLVTALVVGGLGLAGVVHWGDTAAVDTRPVELPNTLAGMTDLGEASAKKDTKGGGEAIKQRQDRTYARTIDRYRTAFGGAATGVRTYTTDDLASFLTVIAIRADSPGLVTGPSADPADLGLVAGGGVFELDVEGDTQCLYTSSRPVKAGETMNIVDRTTTACRTASDGLTIYVSGVGIGNGYQQMVSLARAAKASIVGS